MKRLSVLAIILTTSVFAFGQQGSASAPKPAAQPQNNAEQSTGSQPAAQPMQANDPNDPLFGVPPLPQGKVSLVGGTVAKLDRVRDKISVNVFGKGGRMDFRWDERTHIYRDGVETTERGIQKGDRVYIDTMRDGPYILARNIRIVTQLGPTDARGQLLSYNPKTGYMAVRDTLSGQPVSFRVTNKTAVKGRDGNASAVDLIPGSLVAVRFAPDQKNRGVAQEVSLIAVPGTNFLFAGKVTHLDMHTGVLSLANRTDNNTYDIQFDPTMNGADSLQIGADVTINADFTGRGYRAKDITVNGTNTAGR